MVRLVLPDLSGVDGVEVRGIGGVGENPPLLEVTFWKRE